MNLGEYAYRIEVFRKTYVLDEQGGRVETLEPVGRFWAYVVQKEIMVEQEAMKDEYRAQFEFHIKTNKTIVPGMIVKFKDKFFKVKIVTVRLPYDTNLICEEVTG